MPWTWPQSLNQYAGETDALARMLSHVYIYTLQRLTHNPRCALFSVTFPLAQRNSLSGPLLLVLLPSCPSTCLCMLFVCMQTCRYIPHILHTCYTLLCTCHCSHGSYSYSLRPPQFPGVKGHQDGLRANIQNVTPAYYISILVPCIVPV